LLSLFVSRIMRNLPISWYVFAMGSPFSPPHSKKCWMFMGPMPGTSFRSPVSTLDTKSRWGEGEKDEEKRWVGVSCERGKYHVLLGRRRQRRVELVVVLLRDGVGLREAHFCWWLVVCCEVRVVVAVRRKEKN